MLSQSSSIQQYSPFSNISSQASLDKKFEENQSPPKDPAAQEKAIKQTQITSFKDIAALSNANEYPLKVTVSGVQPINEMLNRFGAEGKRTAFISGGSLFGYMAALTLHELGFNVAVVEGRSGYSRKNVIDLKADALYSLANLSPSGELIRGLLSHKLITPYEKSAIQENNSHKGIKQKSHRLLDWLAGNFTKIPNRLKENARNGNSKKLACLNVEKFNKQQNIRIKESLEYLDFTWPNNEAIQSVDPIKWIPELESVGSTNLAVTQIKDLEAGLNLYCANTKGIEIIHGELALSKKNKEDTEYSPILIVNDNEKKEHITPKFPVDLIVIAEGANSKNAQIISEQNIQKNIPTVERLYNRSYRIKLSDVKGFGGASITHDASSGVERKILSVVKYANRPNEGLVSVSVWGRPPAESETSLFTQEENREKEKQEEEKLFQIAQPHINSVLKVGGLQEKELHNIKFHSSGKIDVKLKRTPCPIKHNVIVGGDAVGAGSPIGGLGGSLALYAYPAMIKRLVTHQDFNSKDPKKRDRLECEFKRGIAEIVRLRHGISRDKMKARKLDFYSKDTIKEEIKNDILAIKDSLPSDIDSAIAALKASNKID